MRQPNGPEYARILLFSDNLLSFYQAFGVKLPFNRYGMSVTEGGGAVICVCYKYM